MIIQASPPGAPRRAISMWQHTALCEQFARLFGNSTFDPLDPLDLMIFVIGNHDAGWSAFDRRPLVDPATSLPYNLVDTPPEQITKTSKLSPDFNERQHPYCGLISSMHSWGLYNGRYGLSDLVLLDKVAERDRSSVEAMLKYELERQARLRDIMLHDSASKNLLNEDKIMQNYKQLQFIDTLALYFNRIHPTQRSQQVFTNVPVTDTVNTTVTIRPLDDRTYALSPYPFASEKAEFGFGGRDLAADVSLGNEEHAAEAIRTSPTAWETFRLVAG